jgi:lysophospholipase L1-like esterase
MNHRRKQRLAVVALGAIVAVGSWGASSGMTKLDTASTSSAPSTAHQQAPASTLKVAYIGGSITEGAFSTTPEKSYTGLLTAWLGTRYRKVEARNLGVGGTGSEFAVYRLNHDLAGFVPDLAFLEFSVNDAGTSRAKITAQIDAIVYELRRANPRVKIVYISTTDVGELPQRKAGHRASFVEDSAAVAAFEKLQFIDATTGMWAKILAGAPASAWLEDNVHPNDAGHKLYFETIRNVLAPQIPLAVQPAIGSSRLIDRSQLKTARLEPATGCKRDAAPPKYLGKSLRYMDKSVTCSLGDHFVQRFKGTTVGIVRAMVKDGGQMDCTLDGAASTTVDFYDSAVAIYDRPAPLILYRNLVPGPHVLACSVNETVIRLPSGRSAGRRSTIGYVMVSDEQPIRTL